MERYFIANPEAKELAVFPDGAAYLLTNKYEIENYAKQTKQGYEIIKREDVMKAEKASKTEEVKEETKSNKNKNK